MLYLKPLSAEEVMTKLAAVAAQIFPGERTSWSLSAGIAGLNGSSVANRGGEMLSEPSAQKIFSVIRDRPYLIAVSASIANDGNQAKVQYDHALEKAFAKIEIHASSPPQAAKIIDAVAANFSVTSYIDIIAGIDSASQSSALQLRERAVSDLHEEVSRLGTCLTSLAEKNTEHLRSQLAEMEKDFREKANRLDLEHQAKLEAAEARRVAVEAELDDRKRQLDEKIAGFETKEAKYVRRQLMDRLDALLTKSETLELSAGTRKKRHIIHAFSWITLVCSGTLLALAGRHLLGSATFAWHLVGPVAAWSIMFFGTLVYYLKWNDRWFREHAETEFSAKRYKADIVRASWIAELESEWGEGGRNALPSELVGAFTKNLFRYTGPAQANEHPVGQLAQLLKNVKRIEIGEGKLAIGGSDGSGS